MDRHRTDPLCPEDTQVGGPKSRAGQGEYIARGHVVAGVANEVAGRNLGRDDNGVIVIIRLTKLHHGHRVRTVGDRCARHDANGLARCQRASEDVSGADGADDL